MKNLSCSLLYLFLLSQIALGQIPQTMTYQGIIVNEAGEVITDGTYSILFKLYESKEGGALLWTEEQSIDINSGIINVVLGKVVPLTLPFNKPYWLGVTLDGKNEFIPRIQLTSSAYSLNARSIADSIVTSRKIADGAITPEKLAPSVHLEMGNNLDQAYDQGGPGKGRTVFADHGPVTIEGDDGLVLTGKLFSEYVKIIMNHKEYPGRSLTLQVRNTQQIIATNDLFVKYNGGISFWENDSQMMSINPGGNVGIATKTPQAKLHIAGQPGKDGIMFPDGTLQTSAASGSGNSLDQAYDHGGPGLGRTIIADAGPVEIYGNDGIKVSSNPDRWPDRNLTLKSWFRQDIIATNDLAITYNGGIGFYEGGKQTLSLYPGGNFGIGTPAPKAKLEVAGEPGVDGIMFPDGSLQTSAASDRLGGYSTKGYLAMYNEIDSLENSIVVEKDDKIGIGNPDPGEKLDVSGNIYASGNIKTRRHFLVNSAKYPERTLTLRAGTAQNIEATNDLYLKYGGGISFWESGTKRMSIDPGGFLNVGNASEPCTLNVYGPILQRGDQLHADYVFEPGYTLESIESHSDFMWQNKHLAAIPKSSIDDEGRELVDIGMHRKGIVEELEKAHIYIDQLLKRIKRLEQHISELEDRNPQE